MSECCSEEHSLSSAAWIRFTMHAYALQVQPEPEAAMLYLSATDDGRASYLPSVGPSTTALGDAFNTTVVH